MSSKNRERVKLQCYKHDNHTIVTVSVLQIKLISNNARWLLHSFEID